MSLVKPWPPVASTGSSFQGSGSASAPGWSVCQLRSWGVAPSQRQAGVRGVNSSVCLSGPGSSLRWCQVYKRFMGANPIGEEGREWEGAGPA